MSDKHIDKCGCFWCSNPEFEKSLNDILKQINMKDHKQRIIILRGFIKGVVALTKLSNVDRLGLLEVIKLEIIDEYNDRRMFQFSQGDEVVKFKGEYIS